MTITTNLQTQTVDGVGALNVSAIIQDPVSGNYVRQIQVYGPPDASGNPVLQFTLVLISDTQGNIEFTAPAIQF